MTHIERVAAALRRLSSEHGLPNRFAIQEIATESGLPNLTVGAVCSRERDFAAIEAKLRESISDVSLFREAEGRPTFIAVEYSAHS